MSEKPLHLTAPWPPSVNRIWRAVGGRVVLSKRARAYKRQLAKALPPGRVPPPLTGRLLVWLTMHPPAKLAAKPGSAPRWDIANREKCLCDVLTSQRVWLDDSQIDGLVILRGEPCAAGRVEITIHTVPGSEPL